MVQWFRFVRFADVPDYEAAGWKLMPCNLGPCHGRWSVLMQWTGEGEPS